jgi:hypothetical protein
MPHRRNARQMSATTMMCTVKLPATGMSCGIATLPKAAFFYWIIVVVRLSDSENMTHGHKPMNGTSTGDPSGTPPLNT